MATILINAFLKNAGVPEAGLSPTIDIWNLDTSTLLVNDAAMTEVGGGNYKYSYTSYDPTVNYSFIVDGTDSLADSDRYLQAGNDDPAILAPKLPTNFIMGSAVQTDKDDEIDAIKAKTDNLPASPAAVGSAMTLANGAITAAVIATDAIDADAIAASAVSEIQSGLATSSALATAQSDLDTITGSDGVTLATAQANYAPAKAGDEMDFVDAPNATAIAAIQSGLATPTNITAGTITTVTNLTNAPTNGDLTATMKASVNTEVDAAIETYHLDHLLAATYDPASKPGAADALLNELIENDGGVSRYTANALEQAPTGGSAPTAVEIRQEIDANSTQLAAIVTDTNELQTDWANGGRLDNILDARASQTSVDTIDGIADDILADTADMQPKLGTISNLGGGATLGANLADIEAQTDDIGAAGAGLTAIPWNSNWDAEVQSEVADALSVYDPPTAAELTSEINDVQADIAALNNLSAAQVNSEVDTALADIHLDHLLAADYDPASKPGTSTALLNELIGNDGGVSQFTANALELAPTGGSAPTAAQIADAVLEELLADHDDTNGSLAEAVTLIRKLLQNRVRHSGTTITIYDDDGTTPLFTRTPKDKSGNAINSSSYDANIPAEVTSAA